MARDSLGLSLSGSDAPRPGGTAALSRVGGTGPHRGASPPCRGLPPGGSGWLAGLNDRFVGAALALVHGRPGSIGRWSGSRARWGFRASALAERFSLAVGEPIFGFLTNVRLQLAAHELATTAHSIEGRSPRARVTRRVNSFSRAFKRAFGKPPSIWRRKSRRRR